LVVGEVAGFVSGLVDLGDAEGVVFDMVEEVARASMARMGNTMIREAVAAAGRGDLGPVTGCGHGHRARRMGVRPKTIRTMTGPVGVDRWWYHCRECGRGFAPVDDRFGITGVSMSGAVTKALSLTGMDIPFGRGAAYVEQITGVDIGSGSTLGRVTRRTGRDAQDRLAVETRAVEDKVLVGLPPIGVNIGYVLMDGTGAPMVPRETAGRPGKAADGKAHTREVKIGCLFTQTQFDRNGVPVVDDGSASYVATFHDTTGFTHDLGVEILRRGFQHLPRLCVLGDGAKWIWNLADQLLPDSTQIVDYYHATEHIHDLADLLEHHLDDKQDWLNARLDDLDHGDTQAIHAAVTGLCITDPGLTGKASTAVEYFTRNHHRMQYHTFLGKGFFIGSGAVEGSCKSIVAQRAKQAGMRWTINGLSPVLTLRALHRSHDRDQLIWGKNLSQTTAKLAA
jgi:hypothetical protein